MARAASFLRTSGRHRPKSRRRWSTAIAPEDVAIAGEAAEANEVWHRLDAPESIAFPWDPASTYIRRPPFVRARMASRLGTYNATVLLSVGATT